MTITARGTVYLDDVQLTTDPQVYQPLRWPKRVSVHQGIGGSVTIQDFGTYPADGKITIGSGSGGFLEQGVVDDLVGMKNARGATYTLEDWLGNEFEVFILSFDPEPTFIGSLWRYTMELQIVEIITLLGTSYGE